MAVTIIRKTVVQSIAAEVIEKTYTISDALSDLNRGRKGTLMFVNQASGMGYVVIGHTPGSPTILKGPDKKHLHVMITEREARIYIPLWRI